ncbi:MAG TPA: endolytic transglycosylase MltG [Xanthobacteraceae bacterium]
MEQRISPRSPRAALEPERVPMPTHRSSGARHPLVIAGNAVFTILILFAIVAGGALFIGKQRFEAPGPLTEDKTVNVPRGGIRDVGDLLKREGVIDQPLLFVGGVIALKVRGDLKFGEYEFSKHASLHDVITTITEGKVVQHAVSIPEGLTSQQVVQRLLDSDVLTGNIREVPPEGALLPETYKVPRGMAREQLLKTMEEKQRRLVQDIWDHRMADLPIKSPQDLVTLASIIEKETGRAEERTRVAAVFVNRLKQHMRLQSDPTIIYGLIGGKGSLGHPILESEKRQPTPYNTYVIEGLPPGPIANPGRASLEAAANPARTKELYFVADGNGGHVFAENYDQHQRNVERLRGIERQQHGENAAATIAAAPAPAPAPAAAPAATPPQPAAQPMRPAAVKRSVKRHPAHPPAQP